MFRYILELIVVVVIITLLRSVIGVLLKIFGGAFGAGAGASSNAGQTPRRPSVPAGGELKKDPVCGTFIAAATSIQKKIGSETYYFCSVDCRDKFKA
jgi:YHS domain-containing protein